MEIVPIGEVRSPYRMPEEAPQQGRFSDVLAELEVYPPFAEGLKDVEQATHLIVLYWCHLASRDTLVTRTPHGPEERGVFACRSPSRPNPIAFCVAELVGVEGRRLLVRGLDAVDGSPLLDIKPYSSRLDAVSGARIGWFEHHDGGVVGDAQTAGGRSGRQR
ncbi:MAG: tRNA (N6-threonylcarbamoyladenosine(37)-N6)-methyltransferase TrmO [Bacillota bacterium]